MTVLQKIPQNFGNLICNSFELPLKNPKFQIFPKLNVYIFQNQTLHLIIADFLQIFFKIFLRFFRSSSLK